VLFLQLRAGLLNCILDGRRHPEEVRVVHRTISRYVTRRSQGVLTLRKITVICKCREIA